MNRLKTGHVVEFVLWVGFAALLYAFTFDFDQEIEIYKYGASSWPRAILLLIVVAATGQLLEHLKQGNGDTSGVFGAAAGDDGSSREAADTDRDMTRWYLGTSGLLLIPLILALLPQWIASMLSIDKAGLDAVKIVVAVVLLIIYFVGARGNHVGAMLTLPILFAVALQDFGFYSLAPLFMLGVMYLMGERRIVRMLVAVAFTYTILLLLFVSVLYVGLPTGNIHPFYDIGTTLVTILQ